MPNTELVVRKGNGPTAMATSMTDAGLVVAEAACAEGCDLRSVAKALGIGIDTFRLLRERDPRLVEAVERGYAALSDELTHILLRQAREGNTTAAIFLSKARCGWREGEAQEGARKVVNNTQININLPSPRSRRSYMRMVADLAKAEPASDA